MKKYLLICLTMITLLSLLACKKDKTEPELTDFEKLVNIVYASEEILAGYYEEDTIYDGEFLTYQKTIDLKLERKDTVKTEVELVEKTLSASGINDFDTKKSTYTTDGDKKYEVVNGKTYESSYVVPTYFLTFVLSDSFLEEGYQLTVDKNNYTLNGKVQDTMVASLFLNKNISNVKDVKINLTVTDGKLATFKVEYISTKTGFVTTITTSYRY